MKKLNFEEKGKMIAKEELTSFQKRNGIILPDEYISFYLEANGGIPKEYIYWNNDRIYCVNHIIPFKYAIIEGITLEDTYQFLVKEKIMSSSFIPFVLEESGGYFMLSTSKQNYGKIYFMSSEICEDSIIMIGDNLSDFLSHLTDEHPE